MLPVIASNFAVSGANDYVTASSINCSGTDCDVGSIGPVVDLRGCESAVEDTCEDLSKSDLVSPTRFSNELPLASMPSVRIMSSEAFYRSCFKTVTPFGPSKCSTWQAYMGPEDGDVSDITYNHQKNRLPDLLRRLRPFP